MPIYKYGSFMGLDDAKSVFMGMYDDGKNN